MENIENDENLPKPKIEKVSLSAIKNEVEKQQDEEFQKKFDLFIEHFKALTPEEQEQFLKRK